MVYCNELDSCSWAGVSAGGRERSGCDDRLNPVHLLCVVLRNPAECGTGRGDAYRRTVSAGAGRAWGPEGCGLSGLGGWPCMSMRTLRVWFFGEWGRAGVAPGIGFDGGAIGRIGVRGRGACGPGVLATRPGRCKKNLPGRPEGAPEGAGI
ncbi:MAG: hypothetical protein JXA42_08720, partial [Anaerolineales bacterium]|nr:hypothetical protein [Anaerolineales bacterium]